MSQNTERGARSERGSALWGTGSRGGDRSSVLWGKGGRGILVSCVAAFALAAPMAAMADSGKERRPSKDKGAIASSFIAPSLLNATGKVDVIIQSSKGASDAASKAKGLGVFQKDMTAARPDRRRRGGRAGLPAEEAGGRARPHRDAERGREAVGRSRSTQLWPYESGNARCGPATRRTYVGKTAGDRGCRLGHPEPRRLRQIGSSRASTSRRSRATPRSTTSAVTAPSSPASRRALLRIWRAPLLEHRSSRSR